MKAPMLKCNFIAKVGFFTVTTVCLIFLNLSAFAAGFGQSSLTMTAPESEADTDSTNDDFIDSIVLPITIPKTPIDPKDPIPDDDDDDNGDDEVEDINQVIEIVLNQDLLDTITQDILPPVADELGLNDIQTPDDIAKETDVGACHVGGNLKIHDIKINLPISEDTFAASFASDSKLKTSWDFSEDSYFTAKLKLDVPRTPVGGDCTVLQWLLFGDLYITGDISVSGIKIDADFALGVKNNKVQIKNISTFDADLDAINVEIDDLEGGGLIKLLIDAGLGITTEDFSCAANSSFEECLEIWAEGEIIKSIEGDDIKASLKEAVNTSLAMVLAIEETTAVAGQDIAYAFKLTGLENTPDEASLITQWSATLTNNGANDSCASSLTFNKDMKDVTTYDDQGAVDTYLPFWLIEQVGYFIGKWGYFCADNTSSVDYDGVAVSYQVAIKPQGEVRLLTEQSAFDLVNTITIVPGSNGIVAGQQPLTNQTAPAPKMGFQQIVRTQPQALTNTVTDQTDTGIAESNRFSFQNSANFTIVDQNQTSMSLLIPVDLTFSGNIKGTATATLKAKAKISGNDSQGLNLKILSAAIEDVAGSVTISFTDGRAAETVDVNDIDVLSALNTAFNGSFDSLDVPLIPQVMDFNDNFGLTLTIDDLSLVDNAALKIPLKLSRSHFES